MQLYSYGTATWQHMQCLLSLLCLVSSAKGLHNIIQTCPHVKHSLGLHCKKIDRFPDVNFTVIALAFILDLAKLGQGID